MYDLHAKIAKSEKDKKLQEQFLEELWAIQTYVTSLKRKVNLFIKFEFEHKAFKN